MNNTVESAFNHLNDDVCEKLASAACKKSQEMGVQVCSPYGLDSQIAKFVIDTFNQIIKE